jgi:hypothetical protein
VAPRAMSETSDSESVDEVARQAASVAVSSSMVEAFAANAQEAARETFRKGATKSELSATLMSFSATGGAQGRAWGAASSAPEPVAGAWAQWMEDGNDSQKLDGTQSKVCCLLKSVFRVCGYHSPHAEQLQALCEAERMSAQACM